MFCDVSSLVSKISRTDANIQLTATRTSDRRLPNCASIHISSCLLVGRSRASVLVNHHWTTRSEHFTFFFLNTLTSNITSIFFIPFTLPHPFLLSTSFYTLPHIHPHFTIIKFLLFFFGIFPIIFLPWPISFLCGSYCFISKSSFALHLSNTIHSACFFPLSLFSLLLVCSS